MPNPKNLEGHGFQPGESGNPAGRPVGIKNWSTVVQDLLADTELPDKLLKDKPGWWDGIMNKNAAQLIAMAMIERAMLGDDKAATWLRKTGYGDKIDLRSGDKPIKAVSIFDMRSGQKLQIQAVPETPAPKPKPKKRKIVIIKKPANQKTAKVVGKTKQRTKTGAVKKAS